MKKLLLVSGKGLLVIITAMGFLPAADFTAKAGDGPENAPARSNAAVEASINLPGPRLICKKTGVPPVIDGKLDDQCWKEAVEAGNFSSLSNRDIAREQTRSYLAYDKKYLYAAFLCKESFLDPVLNQLDKFKAATTTRDSLKIFGDDSVEIFISPSEDAPGYYHIAVNSLGTVYDSKADGAPESWDAEIKCKGATVKGEWTVEIAIPLDRLGGNSPEEGKTWRLNLCRNEPEHPQEIYSSWSPVSAKGFHSPECFGYLIFGSDCPAIKCPELSSIKTGENRMSVPIKNLSSRSSNFTFRLFVSYDNEQNIIHEVSKEIPAASEGSLALNYKLDPDNRCLKLDVPPEKAGSTIGAHAISIPVKPDKIYQFSAMVKTEKFGGASNFNPFYISSYDNTQKLIKGYQPAGAPVDGQKKGWQEVTGTWHSPENASSIIFWIVNWAGGPSGAFRMDDISLIEEGTEENIIPNGNFPRGNESAKWSALGGFDFDQSYGAGAEQAAYFYQVLSNDKLVYQSPQFRCKLEQISAAINSEFMRILDDGNGSTLTFTIDNLSIAAGTAESVVLALKSPKRKEIDKVYFQLEVPYSCELVNDFNQRECVSPIACSEEAVKRDGECYRKYILAFNQNAVSDGDCHPHEILPIPLILKAVGAPAEEGESKIYYHAWLNEKERESREHKIRLAILPPLSAKRPAKLPITFWPSGGQGQDLLVSKWSQAGFNGIPSGRPEADKLFLKYGMYPFALLPTIEYSFPYSPDYLAQYPEYCDRSASGAKRQSICFAHLMEESCPFRKQIKEVITRYVQAFPHHLNWDYEFPVARDSSPGFSEKNIELFRKTKNIPSDIKLTPENILKEYRGQWVDFRCWQNGEFAKMYRQYIKEANPDCLFSFYSGYQSPQTAEHYGVDWRYIGKYVDLVMCGYGRGPFKETLEASGKKYMHGGELVWGGYYDLDFFENTIFQRLTDCGSFMTYTGWILDGRFFKGVSRAAAVASDFEDFFLNLKREDSLVKDMKGEPRSDIAVLTHQEERLIFIFNSNPAEKKIEFRNEALTDGMLGMDYDAKQLFKSPSTISATVSQGRVKVIYLAKSSDHASSPTAPVPVATEGNGDSSCPIFRWNDKDGGMNKYIVQYSDNKRLRNAVTVGDIPVNYFVIPVSTNTGDTVYCRVKSVNVFTGRESKWSDKSGLKVAGNGDAKPATAEKKDEHHNVSIESLGYWIPVTFEPFTILEKDYQVTHGGAYSLKIHESYDVSYGYWTNWRQPNGTRLLRVKEGDKYSFSAWVKTEGEKLGASVSIGFINEKGAYLPAYIEAKIKGTKNWQILTASGKVPKGAVNLRLLVGIGGPGTAWFDDFKLENKLP